jgi:hypothetical protein
MCFGHGKPRGARVTPFGAKCMEMVVDGPNPGICTWPRSASPMRKLVCMILFSEPGGTMSGGSASGLWLQSSKGFQRDPRSHESLDEEACSRPKVPAFGGSEYNILAAFIQRNPDFAPTAQNPSAIFQIHPFRAPF